MIKYAGEVNKESYPSGIKKLFSAPLVFNNHNHESLHWGNETFYSNCWKLYSKSVFSWQPFGDSPTRRGFYDSWMFGCIPVISNSSAKEYSLLFRG
jgi:hypothetical protein